MRFALGELSESTNKRSASLWSNCVTLAGTNPDHIYTESAKRDGDVVGSMRPDFSGHRCR
jgi:hypothetical protein